MKMVKHRIVEDRILAGKYGEDSCLLLLPFTGSVSRTFYFLHNQN